MFNRKILPAALASALLAGTAAVQAESPISANVTLATDYVFRGISQSAEKGAIQGGFDYAHDTGLYAGIWASNINFGGEASTEMDYYGGFAGETDGGFGYDVGLIYYDYEGESELDYLEFMLGFSFVGIGVSVNYSDEFGDGGPELLYFNVNYGYDFTDAFSIYASLGYTDTDEEDFWEEGADTYTDYSLGVTYNVLDLDLGLTYYGTDLDDVAEADDRVVFSVSRSF